MSGTKAHPRSAVGKHTFFYIWGELQQFIRRLLLRACALPFFAKRPAGGNSICLERQDLYRGEDSVSLAVLIQSALCEIQILAPRAYSSN
jgi:hypothetical protein